LYVIENAIEVRYSSHNTSVPVHSKSSLCWQKKQKNLHVKLTLLSKLISASYKLALLIYQYVPAGSTVVKVFFCALGCRSNGLRLLQNSWSQRTCQLNTRGITNS